MEQFYGVLISIMLGVLILALGIIGRMFLTAQRKQIERSDQHHDDIIRLQGGYKGVHLKTEENYKAIYKTRNDFTAQHKTLDNEVRAIDKRVTKLEK